MVHFYELSQQETQRRQRLILSQTNAAKTAKRHSEAEFWYKWIRYWQREGMVGMEWVNAYAVVFSEYVSNIERLKGLR